jgi:hypothetical protein
VRFIYVLAAFLALVAAGCDGYTSVRGRVLTADGKPIPNASVKLTRQPDGGRSSSTTTDDDGRFSVGTTHAPSTTMPFLLEVSKEGFVSHEERLTGTASYEKDVVLQPAKK